MIIRLLTCRGGLTFNPKKKKKNWSGRFHRLELPTNPKKKSRDGRWNAAEPVTAADWMFSRMPQVMVSRNLPIIRRSTCEVGTDLGGQSAPEMSIRLPLFF